MTGSAATRPAAGPAADTVGVPADGPDAPPRANGELVFEAPWQGRVFGLCVALLAHEGLGWDAFRVHLVAALRNRPEAPYYECFAEALEAFACERGLVGDRLTA